MRAPAPPPAPPAPPPAPPVAPAPGRYEEALQKAAALPSPDDGMERLYRVGEIATNYKPPETVRLWGRDVPYEEFQRVRAARLADSGARDTNPSGAAGRWFGNRAEDMDYYINDNPTDTPVYVVDVPKSDLPEMNVRATPYAGSSLNQDREFVLTDRHLANARRLMAIGAPITMGVLSGLNDKQETR